MSGTLREITTPNKSGPGSNAKEEIWYLCIYVTAKKPNFPERFRADNGKNRNIPERNLSKQTIK